MDGLTMTSIRHPSTEIKQTQATLRRVLLRIVIAACIIAAISILMFLHYGRDLPRDAGVGLDVQDYERIGPTLAVDSGFEQDGSRAWHLPDRHIHLANGGRLSSRTVGGELDEQHQFFGVSQEIAISELPEFVIIEGWVRTDGLRKETHEGTHTAFAAVYAEFLHAEPEEDWERYGHLGSAWSKRTAGTNDWTHVAFAAKVPARCAYIKVGGHAHATTGQVFFDDINVYRAKPIAPAGSE